MSGLSSPPQGEISKDRWSPLLNDITRDYRGAHARVEVLGPEAGYNVETENRPFAGLSADTKDGENAVWILFGSEVENHLAHGVQGVTNIRMPPPASAGGELVLEIEAGDRTKTILTLTQPELFELPPAEGR